jgi:outer membrane protein assembly factor BamB
MSERDGRSVIATSAGRSSLEELSLTAGLAVALLITAGAGTASADDQPQWGQRYSRNMVSAETGLPDRFGPKTGENVGWCAELGSECYSTPVVAGGKVLIGTNNGQPRDPKHRGDRGVLMCLNEADGSFAWQQEVLFRPAGLRAAGVSVVV